MRGPTPDGSEISARPREAITTVYLYHAAGGSHQWITAQHAARVQASRFSLAPIGLVTRDQAAEFLRHAENTVRLGPNLVARGVLDANDWRALGEYALGVLRANRQLA